MRPSRAQIGALASIIEALELDGADIHAGSYDSPELRGVIWLTVRDRWSVEHFRIDRHGIATRPGPREAPRALA